MNLELDKKTLFEQDSFVYLPNFLDEVTSRNLTVQFKKILSEGQGVEDAQCENAMSLGKHVMFEELLHMMTPHVENILNKKLYPTYSYARLYKQGSELLVHKDREACEIGMSITLDFEGDPWPIYMGHNQDKTDCKRVDMNLGDAVLFKGMEIFHWREKYTEGKWQAQVFLHWVDANGPYKEWKYDKRDSLTFVPEGEQPTAVFRVFKNAFNKEKCKRIIEQFEANMDIAENAKLAGEIEDKRIRDCKKISIPSDTAFGASLVGFGFHANSFAWKYDITHAPQCEFLRYGIDGKFIAHTDSFLHLMGEDTRKLTVILFLNDDYEGGRFYLETGSQKEYPLQSTGTVCVFPSFCRHGVEPVTKGVRRSVVSWLVGPAFK